MFTQSHAAFTAPAVNCRSGGTVFVGSALGSVRALFVLTEINPHGLTRPLAMALTLGCAALSWSFVEAPLIKLGTQYKVRTRSKGDRPHSRAVVRDMTPAAIRYLREPSAVHLTETWIRLGDWV